MPTVRVDSIAAGGDGVGRLDGLAVFIPRTAPGELVEASVRQRGRMARGRLLRVVEPSPDRVAPRCRHYDGDHCGGCQLQHLTIEAQLRAKQQIVRDAFARIAKRQVDLPPIVPSPAEWEYRSRSDTRSSLAPRRLDHGSPCVRRRRSSLRPSRVPDHRPSCRGSVGRSPERIQAAPSCAGIAWHGADRWGRIWRL